MFNKILLNKTAPLQLSSPLFFKGKIKIKNLTKDNPKEQIYKRKRNDILIASTRSQIQEQNEDAKKSEATKNGPQSLLPKAIAANSRY